jgi:hypothetical protein
MRMATIRPCRRTWPIGRATNRPPQLAASSLAPARIRLPSPHHVLDTLAFVVGPIATPSPIGTAVGSDPRGSFLRNEDKSPLGHQHHFWSAHPSNRVREFGISELQHGQARRRSTNTSAT